jgi:hypothetical protein
MKFQLNAYGIAGVASLALFPLASGAAAAGIEILAPHRAVYDLTLKEASERSGIQSMGGRIVYEITGNECEGITVRYRFVTRIATNENSYQTDQQTTTFESPDGREFTFLTKTLVDDLQQRMVRGTAIRTEGGIKVDLSAPIKRQVDLPDAVFISTHLVALIEHARDGSQFSRHTVYDASEEADEVVDSSAVIGRSKVYGKVLPNEGPKAVALLDELRAWPVTVSYFEPASGSASERLPSYEASFLLYENGISRDLVMRYDDYSLSGHLSALEMLADEPCRAE